MNTLKELLLQTDRCRRDTLPERMELIFTEEMIRHLNRLVSCTSSGCPGNYRPCSALLPGTEACAPDASDVPRLMGHLISQIQFSQNTLHPVELAAMACKRLLDIQPFPERNTETAVLLMNFVLTQYGYAFTVIPRDKMDSCFKALEISRKTYDMEPFSRLIAECVIGAQ